MSDESEEERVEVLALVGIERGEELAFDPLRDRTELAEGPLAGRSQADEMTAPVARIAAALDEGLSLQLVQETDEVASVVSEGVGDRRLRLTRALVEEREDGKVLWAQPRWLEGLE